MYSLKSFTARPWAWQKRAKCKRICNMKKKKTSRRKEPIYITDIIATEKGNSTNLIVSNANIYMTNMCWV